MLNVKLTVSLAVIILLTEFLCAVCKTFICENHDTFFYQFQQNNYNSNILYVKQSLPREKANLISLIQAKCDRSCMCYTCSVPNFSSCSKKPYDGAYSHIFFNIYLCLYALQFNHNFIVTLTFFISLQIAYYKTNDTTLLQSFTTMLVFLGHLYVLFPHYIKL